MTMTTMNVKELIQMLPQDIIQYIIPFTYMPQPVTLLLDIKNFVETRETISEIYYNRNKDLLQYEKNADKNWLVNDILLFVKLNKNERYRSFLYMYQEFICTKKDIYTQFNLFWSSLSIEYRQLFIQIRKPKPKKPLS
jgi:hypothetical protein